jgi:hypothetical protein
MNADADVDLLGWLLPSIVLTKLRLNILRALHGVNNGGEVHEEGIPNGLDDRAVMFSNGPLDNLIMDVKEPQHAGFIAAHLAAKTHHVGEYDGGQPSVLRVYRAAEAFLHGYGLFCRHRKSVN